MPSRNIKCMPSGLPDRSRRGMLTVLGCTILACATPVHTMAADLRTIVPAVKRSVVGVGTFERTRSPSTVFVGTGFVVGDGLDIITNAHVIPTMSADGIEQLGIVLPDGEGVRFRVAELVARDNEHDLAHLRISGTPLPALELGDSDTAQEGQELALTGFPLAMALGLHAATHRATLAAITPIVRPSLGARNLDPRQIAALQRSPFNIFQLDGTAYPGNSGSPVYDPATGKVLGVINAVFVKGLKETAITAPSGITYAVPSNYVRDLLRRK